MSAALLERECPRKDPETALMLRARHGDDAAFAELASLYWSRIFARIYRALGDRQEAEDLTQDVFVRLYRSRGKYQAKAKFSTWIYFIAQNVIRNAIRSRKRRPATRRFVIEMDEMQPHSPATPDSLETGEVKVGVRRGVAQLMGRQRDALEMLQFQNRSYAEIASELDLTLKATKSLLYRARLQLRDLLAYLVEC